MIHPATLHPFADPAYQAPSREDVLALLALLDIKDPEAALIAGVNDRAVRAWRAAPDTKTHAHIPYAAWRLLLQAAGLAKAAKRLRPAKGRRSKRPIMKPAAQQESDPAAPGINRSKQWHP